MADSYVRLGTFGNTNYGSSNELRVKFGNNPSYIRRSYLKFDLSTAGTVGSAILRIYGSNVQNTISGSITAHGVTDDSWTELGLTANNAPSIPSAILAGATFDATLGYRDFDITAFIESQRNADGTASIALQSTVDAVYSLSSRETAQPPELVITSQPLPPTDSNRDIYLLIGQSNMAGRATIEAEDEILISNVQLFNANAEWEQSTNPLNRYSTILGNLPAQRMGPGHGFSKTMRASGQFSNSIGLVVNARGATSISSWQKGASEGYYAEALNRTLAAMTSGQLKGILWHQGESDCGTINTYLSRLQTLISDIRADLNLPNLPFVVGELGSFYSCGSAFNNIINQLPNLVNNTYVVDAEGLTAFDGVHFDSVSQRILGQRYAEVFITPST